MRHEPISVLGRKLLQIGIKDADELEQDGSRQGALTGLQLVHVARGNAQRTGQGRLRQSPFLTKAAKPDPDARLCGRHHTSSSQTLQNRCLGTTNLHTCRGYRSAGYACILLRSEEHTSELQSPCNL